MKKILIAGKDEIYKELRLHFNNKGYKVFYVDNGFQAYCLFLKSNPELLITDTKIRLTDGLGLTRLIKKEDPSFPIIGISNREKDKEFYVGLSASFVLKPFKTDNLDELVSSLLL